MGETYIPDARSNKRGGGMKKLRVVVSLKQQEDFEGKDLKADQPIAVSRSSNVLQIYDGEEEIAVFNYWRYWKKLE